jgi:hypothetical protein
MKSHMKSHAPCHHHEILPNSVLTIKKSSFATCHSPEQPDVKSN